MHFLRDEALEEVKEIEKNERNRRGETQKVVCPSNEGFG
jgi:hypothetical protein